MAFQISPSVNVTETDLTLNVVQIADRVGASAGLAQWGPVNKPYLITAGEDDFKSKFYTPNDQTATDFFTMASFLDYSPKAWFTRVVGPLAKNATDNNGAVSLLVRNEDEADTGILNQQFAGVQFIAKYPGSLGNGLKVDIADTTKFATWEFKSLFNYAPLAGEYAIAVVDSSGVFSGGVGEAKQVERLSLYGNGVSGGVKEKRTNTLSGTVTGGTKQVETLTFSGTATGTSITVAGTAVTIVVGDSATVVAGKVATALAAVTATYDSATASGTVVTVTYKSPARWTPIAGATQAGITWVDAVTVYGDATSSITLMGRTFPVTFGDTAATVAANLATNLGYLSNTYQDISVAGAVVSYTYVAYGPSGVPTTSETSQGITATYAITTAGSNNVSLSIFGVTVAVLNGDTNAVAAGKIAAALLANSTFSQQYENISASTTGVDMRRNTVGKKTSPTVPADQAGLGFGVTIPVQGRLGTVLEKYEIMTANKTDKNPDGTTRYFVDAIKTGSNYVFVADPAVALTARTAALAGGVDDYNVNRVAGITYYQNSETIDVNYLFTYGTPLDQKAVADVVDTRRDAIGFVSPDIADVVGNAGDELVDVLDWRNNSINRDSSYLFLDDNWGLIYDKYNGVNRWIPACGATAGLAARSANDVNPWTSPAGHQRGVYKRFIKMAWSANKSQRDELYKVGINSIVTFPNEGAVLYGDKTATSRPSAFGHYNVRSAFIVAEKSSANFAKQFLFEVNDAFTQNQFLNALRPFLRTMISGRAFEEAKVIVDSSNNTAAVKASNTMVGTILLRPLYSINYINLSFVAVGPNVTFDEIGGSTV